MRVTLVIASLGAGGAERVMTTMANYWAEHGHKVTLITLASAQDARYNFYPIRPGIRRIGLGSMSISSHFVAALMNNFKRLKRLRQEIRASQPDFVLSFIDKTNVLTLVASTGLGIPIIASEHIDPRHHDIGPVWAGLRRLIYWQAAALVVLTEGVRGWAERLVSRQAVHVIPNPVSISAGKHNVDPNMKRPGGTIAAMGRLAPQKGFDILLKAFARCTRKHADWSLIILGEGEERERLEALVVELGINNRVSLPGQIQDPWGILRGTDLFVLSSRYEGFPMALVEAMACKLAVISTDCPSGPREIIRDGVDALLVPPNDVDALAAAMDRLMADRTERQRLGARAGEVVERFSIDKIMNMWEKVLANSCQLSLNKESSATRSSCKNGARAWIQNPTCKLKNEKI